MACLWCKTAELKDRVCPNCGKFFYSDQELEVVYGNSYRQRSVVLFSLTDRYIILHEAKHFEQSNNGLGLIGGAVAAAIVTTAKEGKMAYGFYGLHELREAIYPYHNKKFKKKVAIKLIFRDGSELILDRWDDKLMQKISEYMAASGVTIVDGTNKNFGDVFCSTPIVNDDTLGLRVCADIAPRIKMMKGNFVAPAMGGAPAPKAVPKPQPQAPVQRPAPAPAQPKAAPKPPVQQTAPAQPKPAAAPKMPETIAELGIRVKTYQALMRLGVDRVEELTICSREALLVNGIDEAGVAEIEQCLAKFGLALKKKQVHNKPQAPKKPEMVGDLGLSVMSFAEIFNLGISRIDALTAYSREDLITEGVSLEAIAEAEAKLAQHGFALAEPAPVAEPVAEPEPIPEPVVETFSAVLEAAERIQQQAAAPAAQEPAEEPGTVFQSAFGAAVTVEPDSIFATNTAPAPAAEPASKPEPVAEPAPAPVAEPVPAPAEQAPMDAVPRRDPNVKFCRRCGAKLRRSDIFCVECGMDQR